MYYIVVKFQSPVYNTFGDMTFSSLMIFENSQV